MKLKIITDGACSGNPGPAASAFIILKGTEIIERHAVYIGETTNNVAEYKAVLLALQMLQGPHIEMKTEYTPWDAMEIEIFSDSMLVVQQINGNWAVKEPHIAELLREIQQVRQVFQSTQFQHVPRENPWVKVVDEMARHTVKMQKEMMIADALPPIPEGI